MSSKTSILLSNDNEHWYYDGMDHTYCLEIDKQHKLITDEEGMFVEIKADSELGKAIAELMRQRWR